MLCGMCCNFFWEKNKRNERMEALSKPKWASKFYMVYRKGNLRDKEKELSALLSTRRKRERERERESERERKK